MSRRLIVTGGSQSRELVLVDTLVVGRDPACDISESHDPLLSRRHAAFSATAHDAIVRDLGSRNGILVNGTKMPEARLRSGDVVQIGHLQVKFVDEVGPFIDVPLSGPAAARANQPTVANARDVATEAVNARDAATEAAIDRDAATVLAIDRDAATVVVNDPGKKKPSL
jgi:pSer/pThr/pTyr-binding forkhead associated (FHA) protein